MFVQQRDEKKASDLSTREKADLIKSMMRFLIMKGEGILLHASQSGHAAGHKRTVRKKSLLRFPRLFSSTSAAGGDVLPE